MPFRKELDRVVGLIEEGKYDAAKNILEVHYSRLEKNYGREAELFSLLMQNAKVYNGRLGTALQLLGERHIRDRAVNSIGEAQHAGDNIIKFATELIALLKKERRDVK